MAKITAYLGENTCKVVGQPSYCGKKGGLVIQLAGACWQLPELAGERQDAPLQTFKEVFERQRDNAERMNANASAASAAAAAAEAETRAAETTAAVNAGTSVTLAATACTVASFSSLRNSSTAAASTASRRASSVTRAPRASSRAASALPIPWEPPVISTCLLANEWRRRRKR